MELINDERINRIYNIWDDYVKSNQMVLDTKGKELPDIDKFRVSAIKVLKDLIWQFTNGELSLGEFKTSIDSYNKRNNYWGFTAIKGQFFFNQLTKNLEGSSIEKINNLLINSIAEPESINEALKKIEALENYCANLYSSAKDKRLVPNPKSVAYFLSYFWQISNHDKWPIYYTASIQALDSIGLWEEKRIQRDNYEQFFNINHKIKHLLSKYTKKDISNWDVEHAFWMMIGNPNKKSEKVTKNSVSSDKGTIDSSHETSEVLNPGFELSEYVVPRVSKLIELGSASEKSSTKKGYDFENLVAEVFELLDFDVELLGQGTGRNPDAIIRHREANTAFIIDAKAYNSGYSLGTDDRAIREYINHYCPKLQKEGYKKIGFIIVSNEFKSTFENFVNEITWSTDIKRFILLTSEALLYLLAFKTKNRLTLNSIIETIISIGNPVTSHDIIDEFCDI